ncbi:MAG: DNA-binding protein [Blastopirellula sp.]|nr:MAG: DNA-binding protein [Blastopirellula sp.]
MSGRKSNLHLTDDETKELFADPLWAEKYPPILTVDLAAELMNVPKATIYDWSSRGLLDNCKRKTGKHLQILRNRFVKQLFNEGL